MYTQYLSAAGQNQTATCNINCFVTPVNIGYALTVTGNLTCTLAYTFDDVTATYPNPSTASFSSPTWFNINANVTANVTGSITFPIGGLRLTTANGTANTGTAVLVYIQAGLDSPG